MFLYTNLTRNKLYYLIQGSHPTGKSGNFVIYFSRPGKYLEFAHKLGITWNFDSKLGQNFKVLSKFDVSRITF